MSEFTDYNFEGKKAIIRVDFNVPLNDQFEITDDTRMKAAIPTIEKVLNNGGSVILLSHFGRPKGGPEKKYSLKHILYHLIGLLNGRTVKFASDCIGEEAINDAKNLKPGEVLLLENLRFYNEEEKGDLDFAKKLAALGDVYVNDAFGTAHRAHASTSVMAQFFPQDQRMFGMLMDAEVSNAEMVLHNANKPFTAILGGAKVSDKILIIEMLMNKADNIIIGGGMAYTFLRAQGFQIGTSLCEYDRLELANELIEKAKSKGVKLLIPIDSVIADKFASDANTQIVDNHAIPEGWMGLDIAEKSVALFSEVILNSKTILWNGPMGVFEMEKFQQGTKSIALAIAEATKNGAFSLIGGGDSVAAINKFNLADQVSFVSTGGGALLEYFEGKELPGIAAVRE
ncbi:MAG TPA: phosphoglycerate kinase [Chitinophagaceae bacterium]|nr:phosphoglycerate kinase [Chitinophagaceae bacterium]